MARLRVFVSSTYYDLKHVRSSVESFIESLGYEAVLSEKGNIAYRPDAPLDESCYREAKASDILVLIVGGRYGSEASSDGKRVPKEFFDRYDSITRLEYRSAVERDIPIYILIDRAVYAEYQTFLRNRENKDVQYAHVDSVNVFAMIEEILSQPRNNPVKEFDRYHDIESWLREQWAGLFNELLRESSSRSQISSLAGQVAQLSELNSTLKRYLEEVINSVAPGKRSVIQAEERRLTKAQQEWEFEHNPAVRWLMRRGVETSVIRRTVAAASDFSELLRLLEQETQRPLPESTREVILRNTAAQRDINDARKALELPPIKARTTDDHPAERRAPRKKRKPIANKRRPKSKK
jgi:hypothetical protein